MTPNHRGASAIVAIPWRHYLCQRLTVCVGIVLCFQVAHWVVQDSSFREIPSPHVGYAIAVAYLVATCGLRRFLDKPSPTRWWLDGPLGLLCVSAVLALILAWSIFGVLAPLLTIESFRDVAEGNWPLSGALQWLFVSASQLPIYLDGGRLLYRLNKRSNATAFATAVSPQ